MKPIFVLILTTLLCMTSCGTETQETIPASAESIFDAGITEEIREKEIKITSPQDLTQLDSVLSVEKYAESTENTSAYQILFTTGTNQVEAHLILPEEYADAPVMLYDPQIGYDYQTLAVEFAEKGVIVVRICSRNRDGYQTEGDRDLGGEDLIDVEVLLDILLQCDFLEGHKIFMAGSSEGSIRAFRMAQLHGDDLAGVAVIDGIVNLQSMCAFRGEGITALMEALIGGTYDAMPEEYEKRSVTSFWQEIDIPICLMDYSETPFIDLSVTQELFLSMRDAGKDVEYTLFEKLSSDFVGEPSTVLIAWMQSK